MSYITIDPSLIESQELFPLPLVAMEHFWLWDDTPLYPKRFRIVIELTGTVNVPRLQRSIAIAAARNPLLISTIQSNTNCQQWIIPSAPRIGWLWNVGPWQESPFPDEWDLATESGLRMWGSQNGGVAEFTCETHHACSDALGIRQFLRDIFVAYDQWTREPECQPKLPTIAYERLKERGFFSRPNPTENSRSTTIWEKIVGAYHFHILGPTSIAAPHADAKNFPRNGRHHYFRHTFDRAATNLIEEIHSESAQKIFAVQHAENSSAPENSPPVHTLSTLNDSAIARLIQMLAAWNEQRGSKSPNQRIRIMIPTDLRTLRDSRSPASNRLGFGFVVAKKQDCREYSRLLVSVQSQTKAIRKLRLGLDFVEIFGLFSKQPKIAAWLIGRPRCLATAILTNMGDSFGRFRKLFDVVDGRFKVGDVFVESFAGFPPLRPKTLLGIGMSRSAGRLTIGVIVDGETFTFEQAEQLKQQWIQCWLDSIQPC